METYLFDFDGTLVDSMPAYVSIMKRILDENNISYNNDLIKVITTLGFMKTAEYFSKELGLKMPLEDIIKTMGSWAIDEYTYNIPAKKNVQKVLKQLKEEGVSLNVLTASPHLTLDPCLKRLGLYDLFDNVWSCDDFLTTKADPEIYRMVAEKLGRNVEDILFFDDNYNADKTAKEAGLKVCGVYDETSEEYAKEIKDICDYYIYDFSEILDFRD